MDNGTRTRATLRRGAWSGAIALLGLLTLVAGAAATCLYDAGTSAPPLKPGNPGECARLEEDVGRPGAFALDVYEEKLGAFLSKFCHRNTEGGWVSDKRMRNTGPFVSGFGKHGNKGKALGTHGAVVVWYSPAMVAWLAKNRPAGGAEPAAPTTGAPVPDGAMMVKEMYQGSAEDCTGVDPLHLNPASADPLLDNGAAIMVRDGKAVHSGWFWGWFGWSGAGWKPDWPAPANNDYPFMGFGQYCVNCHASARDNLTFSSLRNVTGLPTVYLSQGKIPPLEVPNHHKRVVEPPPPAAPTRGQEAMGFMAALGLPDWPVWPVPTPTMPSESLDSVWARPKGNEAKLDGFVTSDQCIGCHDAGGTGLQYDMTAHQHGQDELVNLSPYALWRSSPMGLAGRDPIFFAQLASETQSFHPEPPKGINVDDICLGCHGVLGQRAIKAAGRKGTEAEKACTPMTRSMLNTIPSGDPFPALADYAGLGRDGISCLACHRMALWPQAEAWRKQPENACLDGRRKLLNPGLTETAATFTGSFDFGATDTVIGPFEKPQQVPMKNALGMAPVHSTDIASSELCGTCHTINLPILNGKGLLGYRYEQTTYAEWAFSAFRTGWAGGKPLPDGAGLKAQSCQGCHMPSEANGHPIRSKIASIQEYSNFPQTDNTADPGAIDLRERDHFAKHTLVGLNYFLVRMAGQFWDLLGLRQTDPMMGRKPNVPEVTTTQKLILDQAATRTADIAVKDVVLKPQGVQDADVSGEGVLEAKVTVTNRTGHKFPSGVGFRRAFITFTVYDAEGKALWASGRTDPAGLILDGNRQPLASELWWAPNCAYRIAPNERRHQPHRQVITRQDEVQIYEDLTADAGQEDAEQDEVATCGKKTGKSPRGALTTSFLSRCSEVKDNRLLPEGFLKYDERKAIAAALGAPAKFYTATLDDKTVTYWEDLAEEAGVDPVLVRDDPDYHDGKGGSDSLRYVIPLRDLGGAPASVEAEISYQSTAPYFLQDRFCTAKGQDTQRLAYMSANLDLSGTPAAGWRLRLAKTGRVPVR